MAARDEVLGTSCTNEPKVRSLRGKRPAPDQVAGIASACKALGHPARLEIVHLLRTDECCVCDLAHVLEMPVSTVSQHLAKLRGAGLVRSRREGKWVFYTLTDSPIARAVAEDALAGGAL